MTSQALDARLALIQQAEAFRSDVYDDSTGSPIRLASGGTPTIGYGCACRAWSTRLASAVLLFQFNESLDAVMHTLPWSGTLDDIRLGTLGEMDFNLGTSGLLTFQKFLAHLQAGEYAAAGLQLSASAAAHEEPSRVSRWVQEIANG